MIRLYRKIEEFWFSKIPQKIRFLLVGGFNTAAAYAIFAACFVLSGERYLMSLIIQYALSINISILTMRYYAFRSKGPFLSEYAKAAGVYVYLLLFNMLWLHIFIDTLEMNAFVSQALYLIISTLMTYVMHKYFSFRKNPVR